jgi:hypothetical protein
VTEVVLRCPHSGTVAEGAGECVACHEAGVRWYCANHTPARWLDSHVCAGCGATRRHGPIVQDPPSPRTTGATGSGEPRLIEVPSRTPRTPTSGRAITPQDGAERVDPLEMFRRVAAAASGVPAPLPESEPAPEPPPPVARRRPALGWRARLTLAAATLLVLGIGSVWLVGGSPVSNFVVALGQATGLLSRVPTATKRGIEAYRGGDLVTAERELEDAARTYPASALALLYLARIRIEAGNADSAGPLLEDAITREPGNALAHRMLGEYHLARARRGLGDGGNRIYTATELIAAEEQLERAMTLDPKDIRAVGYHACALAVGGRMTEAKIELASAGPGPWEECIHVEDER